MRASERGVHYRWRLSTRQIPEERRRSDGPAAAAAAAARRDLQRAGRNAVRDVTRRAMV